MRFKIIVISVLALIGAYSVFWFQMASKVEESTLNWIENSESRLGGIKVFVGDISVSGFPYKIIVEASTLNIILPDGYFITEPVLLTAPEVAVVFQPWQPDHAIIVTDYFDAVIGTLGEPLANITFDKVKSSVILQPGTMELNNLSVVAQEISWHQGSQTEKSEKSIMEMVEFHLRRSVSGKQDQLSYDLPINRSVFFKAENATIKEFATTILGEQADQIKIEAFLHANEQPDYTRAGLSKWRDEGGTLSIRTIEYGTAGSGIILSGDVTLDENLKPLGAFEATVTGMGNMISRLSTNENISQSSRFLLQSQAGSSNNIEQVSLPISMQNGLLYLGPIMLMELDAVIE